jgi:hydroxymethylbilane synthase
MAQTEQVLAKIREHHPEINIEIKKITTSGDRIQDRFLRAAGGKGLFVKEIEEALLSGEIDLAVHSLKDLPGQISDDLHLVAFPERRKPWDCLITQRGLSLKELPEGARVGTSSLRRRVQMAQKNEKLCFELLRGNINTRLKKLQQGDLDAVVLAQAGLERLNLEVPGSTLLPIVPAPGQGTLALEAKKERKDLTALLKPLHHPQTAREALVERSLSRHLGGDCNLPLGCLAQMKKDHLYLNIFLGLPDGTKVITWDGMCVENKEQDLLTEALQYLRSRGAEEIIQSCRNYEEKSI